MILRNIKRYISNSLDFVKKTWAMIIGYIFYDPYYLRGKEFDKLHFSSGWRFVMQDVLFQKILGIQRHIPFPVAPWCQVMGWENIEFDKNTIGIFQRPGCYFQAAGGAKIVIGQGTYLAGNVGIITANHDYNDLSKHLSGKDVVIGKNCWIGMNCTILPGVQLGEQTIVGAGTVVTKSFPEGHCVIAGNPAKCIKVLSE